MGDWVVGEYVSRCCRGNWRMLRGLVRDRDRDGSQIGREFVCQKASPDLGGQGVLCQLWRVARMGACGRDSRLRVGCLWLHFAHGLFAPVQWEATGSPLGAPFIYSKVSHCLPSQVPCKSPYQSHIRKAASIPRTAYTAHITTYSAYIAAYTLHIAAYSSI